MGRGKKLVIRTTNPPPEDKTYVVEVDSEDHRHLQECLDRVREVGAAEIVREGVIYKHFDDWSIQDLRNAVWED